MASGRAVFLMKLAFAAAVGQACQPTSAASINWPLHEIGLGDEHVDGLDRRDRRLGRFGPVTAARQQRGDAASGNSDTEYDETRGFHYASLPK